MEVMFRSGELEVTLLGNLVRRFFEAGGGEGADFQYGENFSHRLAQNPRDYMISYVRHLPFITAHHFQLSFLKRS